MFHNQKFLCKSSLNPYLEPTSTKHKGKAQGNSRSLWLGSNSQLTGIH